MHILLIFNNISYITLLNMFRAARYSSSGGPILSPQPLVSSPSVSSRTVCGWRADCGPLSTRILYGCLQRVTIPEAVVIQLVLLMMSSVLLETCWGVWCNLYCWILRECALSWYFERLPFLFFRFYSLLFRQAQATGPFVWSSWSF